MRLALDLLRHLLLEIRVGVDDVPLGVRRWSCVPASLISPNLAPIKSRSPIGKQRNPRTKKNTIVRPTMMNTIIVVSQVSFQLGQVTF